MFRFFTAGCAIGAVALAADAPVRSQSRSPRTFPESSSRNATSATGREPRRRCRSKPTPPCGPGRAPSSSASSCGRCRRGPSTSRSESRSFQTTGRSPTKSSAPSCAGSTRVPRSATPRICLRRNSGPAIKAGNWRSNSASPTSCSSPTPTPCRRVAGSVVEAGGDIPVTEASLGARRRNAAGHDAGPQDHASRLVHLVQNDPEAERLGGDDATANQGGVLMEWAVGKNFDVYRENTGKLLLPGSHRLVGHPLSCRRRGDPRSRRARRVALSERPGAEVSHLPDRVQRHQHRRRRARHRAQLDHRHPAFPPS